jgi:hypothetical protein
MTFNLIKEHFTVLYVMLISRNILTLTKNKSTTHQCIAETF